MGWPAASKFSQNTNPLQLPPALLRWRPNRPARPHCRQLEAAIWANLVAEQSGASRGVAKVAQKGETAQCEGSGDPTRRSRRMRRLSRLSEQSVEQPDSCHSSEQISSHPELHPRTSIQQEQEQEQEKEQHQDQRGQVNGLATCRHLCSCCGRQAQRKLHPKSELAECRLCASLASPLSYQQSNKQPQQVSGSRTKLIIKLPEAQAAAASVAPATLPAIEARNAGAPGKAVQALKQEKVQVKREAAFGNKLIKRQQDYRKHCQSSIGEQSISACGSRSVVVVAAAAAAAAALPTSSAPVNPIESSAAKLKVRREVKLALHSVKASSFQAAKRKSSIRSRISEENAKITTDDAVDTHEEPEVSMQSVVINFTEEKVNKNEERRKSSIQEKKETNWSDTNESRQPHNHWPDINRRYRKMSANSESAGGSAGRQSSRRNSSSSCISHLFISTCQFLFPILTSFKGYSIRSDMSSDFVAGFTVAILHIPQGMAYGLLAGVEPIYGLYVSFVPVLVMAFMSKSRHVSHGTFAVISMLLASALDSARNNLQASTQITANLSIDSHLASIVLVDNHQPLVELPSQQILKDFLGSTYQTDTETFAPQQSATTQREHSIAPVANLNNNLPAADTLSAFPYATNIEILTSICLVVGVMQLIMATFRLGCLTLMFSDQLVSSFTTGAAVFVCTSQLEALFDIKLAQIPEGLFKVFRIWWQLVNHLLYQGCNQYTAVLSISSILFLVTIREFLEPALKRRLKWLTCLPGELLLMCLLVLASWYWEFTDKYSIRALGNIPNSLPSPQVPRLDLAPLVLQDSVTIALISFALNLSVGQLAAKRYKYKLNPNQELFALGTSNVISSFFCCFPCASSLSRSAVQSNLNAKSPLCSLISSVTVVFIICYFGPILSYLPRSTLSCIILVALKSIFQQYKDFQENWRLSKLDALIWAVTFISVISCGVTYGFLIGILVSLAAVLYRLCTPHHAILGRVPGTELYVDLNAFVDCIEFERIKIFKINSALCYLNKTSLKSCIEKVTLTEDKTTQLSSLFCSNRKQKYPIDCENNNDKIDSLIIDCSGLSYCDYSGVSTLIDIIQEFDEQKVFVYLAACPLKLINMLENLKQSKILHNNIYPSITDAVNHIHYLENRYKLSFTDSNPDCLTGCQQAALFNYTGDQQLK